MKKIFDRNRWDPPYLIAEAGVNHEGDMDKAKQMVEEVARAGGDAIKFQVYKAGTLASKFARSYWDTKKEKTKSQYELFKKYDSFWKEEMEELADYAKEYKIDFLATPFDFESADFLENLVPMYKIASADITNRPLLEHIAKKGKPMLVSTGASNISEIWRAVEWIENAGLPREKIVLLHCILNYPTRYNNANLLMIKDLVKKFPGMIIGYSDHTLPTKAEDVLATAWLLGAQVIEKHYTWNKSLPGNDHYHAMDYRDLEKLIEKFRFIKEIMGHLEKHSLKSEKPARLNARRSLVATRDIHKGEVIGKDDVTPKRPGTGIPPWMLDLIVGGVALENIKEDEIITFDKVKLIKEERY